MVKAKRQYYAVDLFAGCGGLSEGFSQAGFDVVAQVEMDKWACETLATRHMYRELRKVGKGGLYNAYLKGEVSQSEIFDSFPGGQQSISLRVIQATLGDDGIEAVLERTDASRGFHGAPKIHVLLGGPPCQCYSVVGRARDPFKMENDGRHYLYKHYLEILEQLQPDFFVYENVPGLFSARVDGNKIFTKILGDFESLNPAYAVTPPLQRVSEDPAGYIINSADFGVPQSRKRLILIGYKKSLERKSRTIKNIFARLQRDASKNRVAGALTVADAIGDLPPLRPGQGSDGWLGPYFGRANGAYYKIMRRHSPGIVNHRARTHMASDLERYRFFIEHRLNGKNTTYLTDLIKERPDLAPAHNSLDTFLDRFKVQWWDKPALTITAHINRDGHYYIHPDIQQCRSFTVREAARCQSFTDNYKFEGPRTQQFKQVGNAVPPLLSRAVARAIRGELRKIYG
ncbi:MAG: DNA cytosine methyltransferase [Chloroflexi bacterium]|nr:DNA cytosine methyltransferase [Chloroflexota bacterium]